MKQNLRNVLIVVVIGFIGIQFVPIRASNPESTGEIETDPEIASILERSCYDCHSNATHWPWYGRVAPVSWWIVHHVEEGRAELNFSDWNRMTPKRQEHVREEIWEQVEGGHMPLPDYLRLHGDAKLTEEDLSTLRSWADVEEEQVEHDHSDHEH